MGEIFEMRGEDLRVIVIFELIKQTGLTVDSTHLCAVFWSNSDRDYPVLSGKTVAFIVTQASTDAFLLENVKRIRSWRFGCQVSNGKKKGGSCRFQNSGKDARCERCETLTEHGPVLLLCLAIGVVQKKV
jgi:hypothetical protein